MSAANYDGALVKNFRDILRALRRSLWMVAHVDRRYTAHPQILFTPLKHVVVDKAPPPGKARPRPRPQNRGSRKKTAADVEDEDRSDAQDLEPELAAIRAAVRDKKRKTNGEGGHDAEPPAKRVKPASSASGVHVPPKRSKRLAKKAP
ncbi:hypothetical protein PLICRDRAFT_174441 [Plicaturopsis crispa FD-325 SS-3]|nr:hypothetical protein PLICRDRAFT_174441 [Plicaturopsis crispa FD-325 SS-3]